MARFSTFVRQLLLICALLMSAPLWAANLSVQVLDRAGNPIADAVVYAEPDGPAPAFKGARGVEVEQRGRKFNPLVTVVQTGTSVMFPNNDSVRHHLYSFSPAKTFEVKLYSGVPRSPVTFDKPGTVELGCNIHDQMIAYVHVVNTPWFGKSDASGMAKLDGLAPGKYRLKAWHYNLPPREKIPEQALNVRNEDASVSFTVGLKPATFDTDNQYQPKQYKY